MMATEEIRSLSHRLNNELQVIMGASELGDLDSSLRAWGRAHVVLHSIRLELERQKRAQRVIIWPKPKGVIS